MASARAIEAAKAFVRVYLHDKEMRTQLASMQQALRNSSDAISGIGGTAIVAGMVAAGTGMVALASNAERSQVAFEVMLGSASAAADMIARINRMGAESPFGAAEFTQGAQVLMQFGVAADQVLPTLSMLGDIAAGDAEKLSGMTLAFAQMSASGRLMGQDLLQMINAGFNPLQQISATTGESMAELKKRMEAGGISAQEVADALKAATSEGGRFYGMTQRINKTTAGQWATLKDEVVMLAISMGKHLLPVVNLVVSGLRHMVSLSRGVGKGLVQSIVAVTAFIAAIKALARAQLAYAKAAAVAQAFSGPKGWVVLAIGAVAAAGAVAAVELSTTELAQQASAAHPPLDTMSKDLQQMATAAPAAADGLEAIDEATRSARQGMESLRSPVEKARDAVSEFQAALARSGEFGVVAGANPLVEAFREQESGYTAALRRITAEIDVLSGRATEAGQELQHMLDVGVDPAKVEELRRLMQRREELQAAQDGQQFWAQKEQEMRDSAEQVKQAIETVQESFLREQARLQPLIAAGMLTQEQADQFLRQNPDFRKLMDGGIGKPTDRATPAQDVRSVSGASVLTGLINRTGTVEQQQLSVLKSIDKTQQALARAAEKQSQTATI